MSDPEKDPKLLTFGGALVSGAVIAGATVGMEQSIEGRREHEAAVGRRIEQRHRYQVALGLAESLEDRTLAGLDLSGIRLVRRNIASSDFTDADLRGAVLTESDLRGADFTRAALDRCDLSRCTLGEAQFSYAVAHRARFDGAEMVRAMATGAKFGDSTFRTCDLTGANFTFTSLSCAVFDKAIIDGLDLGEANLSGASFASCSGSPRLDGARWCDVHPPTGLAGDLPESAGMRPNDHCHACAPPGTDDD